VPRDIPRFVEEVVRYRTPAQIMFRQTKQAVELHGVTIRRDAFVLVAVGTAKRDPAAFAEPNRFDPTRDPNPHVGLAAASQVSGSSRRQLDEANEVHGHRRERVSACGRFYLNTRSGISSMR